MYFLFSGEGPTDLGIARSSADVCEGEDYDFGPMAVMVDQIFETIFHYSILGCGLYGYVSESTLAGRATELKAQKKSPKLRGRKRERETLYFHNNARVLARIASEKEVEIGCRVVAVLFRDTDGGASAGRGLRRDKVNSMFLGFSVEEYVCGVPMVPKPKSEAWILCGLKRNHQGCNSLENRSGSDKSPNSLKEELKDHHGGELPSREELNEMVRNRQIDVDRLTMTSFTEFKTRLEEVLDILDS